MQLLSKLLDHKTDDLGIMYYACLNIWILSYHKESFPAFHDDSLGLFKKMITVIETHSREKIDRVAFGTFAVSFPPHFPHLTFPIEPD